VGNLILLQFLECRCRRRGTEVEKWHVEEHYGSWGQGVASAGLAKEWITSLGLIRWPENLLTRAKGREGKFFGSKSGTLEMVGLLIPCVTVPEKMKNQHVILFVDNSSLIYLWGKRYSRNDPETSLLIRALYVIESFLSCKIYVKHVRRLSTPEATLVDHLSREATITPEDRMIMSKVGVTRPWGDGWRILYWIGTCPPRSWRMSKSCVNYENKTSKPKLL
jgi:hypothetical protein